MCVFFCASYILSIKICILRAKGGHFWGVRKFWLVVKGLQVDVRVRGLVGLIRVRVGSLVKYYVFESPHKDRSQRTSVWMCVINSVRYTFTLWVIVTSGCREPHPLNVRLNIMPWQHKTPPWRRTRPLQKMRSPPKEVEWMTSLSCCCWEEPHLVQSSVWLCDKYLIHSLNISVALHSIINNQAHACTCTRKQTHTWVKWQLW